MAEPADLDVAWTRGRLARGLRELLICGVLGPLMDLYTRRRVARRERLDGLTGPAIFVGGVIRWLADTVAKRKGLNEAQMARFGNVGVLMASGMIAGEALMGLVTSGFTLAKVDLAGLFRGGEGHENYFDHPSYWVGAAVIVLLAVQLIRVPLKNAGDPNEPAPPTAMM